VNKNKSSVICFSCIDINQYINTFPTYHLSFHTQVLHLIYFSGADANANHIIAFRTRDLRRAIAAVFYSTVLSSLSCTFMQTIGLYWAKSVNQNVNMLCSHWQQVLAAFAKRLSCRLVRRR